MKTFANNFKFSICRILLLFFSIFYSTHFIAQSSLKGTVYNEEHKPIELARVFLFKDSVLQMNTETDSLGVFHFDNLKDGNFQILVKYLIISKTFEQLVAGITEATLTINTVNEIGEIKVTAEKPIFKRKVDRIIFNVEDIPILVGSSAFEAMEMAPGLMVINDVVKLSSGKEIRVLIDDKLLPLTGDAMLNFIKSIPADNIKSIEIIPVPPAKYDAKLTGGLVNIKLKKSMKMKLSTGSIRGGYTQRFYDSQELGGNFNNQNNKFSLYTNVFWGKDLFRITSSREVSYPSNTLTDENITIDNFQSLTGGLGMNYQLNPKTELGILYVGNYYLPKLNQHNEMSILNNSLNTKDYLDNQFKQKGQSLLNSLTFNSTYTLDSLKTVGFIVDYSGFNKTDDLRFNTKSILSGNEQNTNILNETKVNMNLLSAGLDFNLPFKNITYTVGAKISHSEVNNDFDVFDISSSTAINDKNLSNVFNYKEQIQAAYFSAEKEINKWSFQLGLRCENTLTTGFSETTQEKTVINYFQLVPKVFALYNLNDNNSFSFSYARDFSRPDYEQLNPFRTYQNPLSYFVGNPRLKPQIDHSFTFSYTFKNNLNTSIGYSYGKDIAPAAPAVTFFDPVSLVKYGTYENFMIDQMVDLNVSYRIKKLKRFKSKLYLHFYYYISKANELLMNQKIENFSVYIATNNTFTVDKAETFFAEVNLYYNSPENYNIVRTISYPSISLKMRKLFFNKKMQINLSIKDPFRINKNITSYTSNETSVKENEYYDSQSIQIGFSYNFGNKNVSVNEKSAGSTGESSRIKSK